LPKLWNQYRDNKYPQSIPVLVSEPDGAPGAGGQIGIAAFPAWSTTHIKTPMRFSLIDRIVELEPGLKISAVKTLTMAEEYLADHFPHFPVMPGVLMLEAMTQASAWLVRYNQDFSQSIVVLKEAANVKYGQFLEPGQTLLVTAEIVKPGEAETKLKAHGMVDGRIIVSARITLQQYNLADTCPWHEWTDKTIIKDLQHQFSLLYQPHSEVPAVSAI